MMDAILAILAEDSELIPYRKSLRAIAGSVTATILLQQMIFNDRKHKGQFYKFKSPCDHALYKEGDSWTEELGFSKKEFDSALKRIGTKITKGMSKAEAYKKTDFTGLVIYWTDAGRVTWYHLNRDLLGKLLKGIYLESNQRGFTPKVTKGDLPFTKKKNTTEILEPDDQLFSELVSLLNMPKELMVPKMQKDYENLIMDLQEMGASAGDIERFGKWWYQNDWRGQKGQKPTLAQVRERWGDFIRPQQNGTNGKVIRNKDGSYYL